MWQRRGGLRGNSITTYASTLPRHHVSFAVYTNTPRFVPLFFHYPHGLLNKLSLRQQSESETFVFRHFWSCVHDTSTFLRCPTLSKGGVCSTLDDALVEEEKEEEDEDEEEEEEVDEEGSTLAGRVAEGGPIAGSSSTFCCLACPIFSSCMHHARSKRGQRPALRVGHTGWQGERHRDVLHRSASSCHTTTRWPYTRCSVSASLCSDFVQKAWPYPQLKGPRKSVGVHIPSSRGHDRAWQSISPTRGATRESGSPYSQLKGPRHSVGVRITTQNHAKAHESASPTRGATQKRGNPYAPLEGPRHSMRVRIPNPRGHAKAWEREKER